MKLTVMTQNLSKQLLSPRSLLIIAVLVIVTQSVFATTYHVAKTGRDNNPGTSGLPYLTINKAAQMAQPGDSVIVHAGEYREWVQPARGGSSEATRITYKTATGDKVIIKGSERITNWFKLGNGVWKVEIADITFGSYNPYTYTLAGRYPAGGAEYIKGGVWCHLGEVFLDGERYDERQTFGEIQATPKTWFTTHAGSTTSIYANFGNTATPNTQLAEISVRESVFGNPNASTGINFVTVNGFSMSQSAEEWTPYYLDDPLVSHAVIFVSGTHWIIENCSVTFGKMRGISIDGPDVVANHIVRNNVVKQCGVSGIGGCFDHGSVISGNWIQDIAGREYWGVEHAGIKVHLSKNMVISGNVIYKVTAQNWGMGIWLDYANDGNRITGNVIIKTTDEWLRPENPHGINLFDNNIGLDCGEAHLEDGTVFLHNLAYHSGIRYSPSWVGTGVGENGRVYNNIFISNAVGEFSSSKNNKSDYNAFLDGAVKTWDDVHSVEDNSPVDFSYSVNESDKTVTVNFKLGSAVLDVACPLITTDYFSGFLNDNEPLENPDKSALSIDRDIYQNYRDSIPKVGPFQNIKNGRNTFIIRHNYENSPNNLK